MGRKCIVCGGSMAGRVSKAVLCASAECFRRYRCNKASIYGARRRKRLGALRPMQRCLACGAEFPYAGTTSKLCGPECRRQHRRQAYIAWAAAHPARIKEHNRKAALRHFYGVSIERVEEMYREQGGSCAICGEAKEVWGKKGSAATLEVDHDHRSGAVRGLLCRSCNQGLGHFRDDVCRLESALRYVLQHSAPRLTVVK